MHTTFHTDTLIDKAISQIGEITEEQPPKETIKLFEKIAKKIEHQPEKTDKTIQNLLKIIASDIELHFKEHKKIYNEFQKIRNEAIPFDKKIEQEVNNLEEKSNQLKPIKLNCHNFTRIPCLERMQNFQKNRKRTSTRYPIEIFNDNHAEKISQELSNFFQSVSSKNLERLIKELKRYQNLLYPIKKLAENTDAHMTDKMKEISIVIKEDSLDFLLEAYLENIKFEKIITEAKILEETLKSYEAYSDKIEAKVDKIRKDAPVPAKHLYHLLNEKQLKNLIELLQPNDSSPTETAHTKN